MVGIGPAHAQSTLGEVLDNGGEMITATQWQAMLPHRNFGFGQQSLNRTTVTFTDDGKLTGSELLSGGYSSSANPAQSSRELKGSWIMGADGKLCIDQVFGKYQAVYSGCFYMFRLGDHVFHVDAGSQGDRSAPVTRRSVEQ